MSGSLWLIASVNQDCGLSRSSATAVASQYASLLESLSDEAVDSLIILLLVFQSCKSAVKSGLSQSSRATSLIGF